MIGRRRSTPPQRPKSPLPTGCGAKTASGSLGKPSNSARSRRPRRERPGAFQAGAVSRASALEWFMALGQHTAGSQASAGAERIGLYADMPAGEFPSSVFSMEALRAVTAGDVKGFLPWVDNVGNSSAPLPRCSRGLSSRIWISQVPDGTASRERVSIGQAQSCPPVTAATRRGTSSATVSDAACRKRRGSIVAIAGIGRPRLCWSRSARQDPWNYRKASHHTQGQTLRLR